MVTIYKGYVIITFLMNYQVLMENPERGHQDPVCVSCSFLLFLAECRPCACSWHSRLLSVVLETGQRSWLVGVYCRAGAMGTLTPSSVSDSGTTQKQYSLQSSQPAIKLFKTENITSWNIREQHTATYHVPCGSAVLTAAPGTAKCYLVIKRC